MILISDIVIKTKNFQSVFSASSNRKNLIFIKTKLTEPEGK